MASATERHAGDAEAEAAIRGMQSVYGIPLPDVDQWVTGQVNGRRFSGRVSSAEPGRISIEIDGAWIVCRPSDLDQQ